jgi:hypothetical protein
LSARGANSNPNPETAVRNPVAPGHLKLEFGLRRTGTMSVRGYLLRAGMLTFVLVGGVLCAEWVLQWRYERIARSDRITPGLSRPDPQVGWTLTPGWRGTHQHHDFQAAYSINASGFRGPDVRLHMLPASMIAVVGDSFAFGTGVGDAEAFTHLLDRGSPETRRVYNFSVPGFSTDQELLLAEREILPFKPSLLILVVYLANDLFDNQLPQSLQVRRQKPLFTLDGGRLVLHSPFSPPPDYAGEPPTLLDMVLGNRPGESSVWRRLEARSRLYALLHEAVVPVRSEDPAFASRHAYGLELFWALIERLRKGCESAGTRLALALLGGRSFVESPSSLSAGFQEFFRARLAEGAAARELDLIDVARAMRSRHSETGGRWFYAHEGHLNSEGHRLVAEIISAGLNRRALGRTASGR